jgi:hypothetical protein
MSNQHTKVTDAVASTKKVEASHHAARLARVHFSKKKQELIDAEKRLDEAEAQFAKDKDFHTDLIRSLK